MITITRVYSDTNGESHFEDFEVPLKNNGDIGFLSDDEPVKSIVFREVKPSYDYDFHNAPDRQYIVLLEGGVEIETSLGEKGNLKQDQFSWWKIPQEKDIKQKTSKLNFENQYS